MATMCRWDYQAAADALVLVVIMTCAINALHGKVIATLTLFTPFVATRVTHETAFSIAPHSTFLALYPSRWGIIG